MTDGLVSCATCLEAKGNGGPTRHQTTSRATKPMELVNIDTAGPFLVSVKGSPYIMMVLDSISSRQRPYNTRDKSVDAI